MGSISLGKGSLQESIKRTLSTTRIQIQVQQHEQEEYVQHMARLIQPALALILYLCTVNSEIGKTQERPQKPKPVQTKKGMRLFPTEKARQWDVGLRVGQTLRLGAARTSYQKSTANDHSLRKNVRPHIRLAHWHGYWVGSKSGNNRRFILKWLHPMLIGENNENMPTTIHPIQSCI